MMIRFWNNFTKITAWPVQKLIFRTKVYYEDKTVQGRRFKGPAIVICNHTSVYDLPVVMFTFFWRTLRFQVAELQFEKPLLGWFLRRLGSIRVDRNSHDYGFINQSEEILRAGGAVGVFPESRLPRPGEERPLPFAPSVAYLALSCGVPVIPMYTDGCYFKRKRAHVIIGTPIRASELVDDSLSDKENISRVTACMREKIVSLGKELEKHEQNET